MNTIRRFHLAIALFAALCICAPAQAGAAEIGMIKFAYKTVQVPLGLGSLTRSQKEDDAALIERINAWAASCKCTIINIESMTDVDGFAGSTSSSVAGYRVWYQKNPTREQ